MTNPKPIEVFENPNNYIDFLTHPDMERVHGQWFDWKEIPKPYNKDKVRKEGIIACVSAFANSNPDGGIIVLGINNKTQAITGTEHLNEEQLNAILSFPSLQNHRTQSKALTIDEHRVYLIYTPYEPQNICHTSNSPAEAWKRNGAQNEPFKLEDWEYFRNRKNPGLWEMQPCAIYEERLLDKALFEEFRDAFLKDSEIATSYDIIDVLENAGAITKHQNEWWFTKAGYLFFCSNPQRLFPSAYIRFLKYEAKLKHYPNPGDTVGEQEFKGALPTMIRKIRDWIKDANWFRRYTYRAPDGFSFKHEDEYPIFAIGEAIVNAVVHRDYALQIPIDCKTYSDAFSVTNGGGILQNQVTLPKQFELGYIRLSSFPRNSKLVEWFKVMPDEDGKPFVLRRSEGTRRIQQEIEHLNLPNPVYQTNGETTLTFWNNVAERSKYFFAHNTSTHSTSEYLNLFEIQISGNTANYEKNILQKELLNVLKDNLQVNNWYVDRFNKSRLTLHQRGDTYPLNKPRRRKNNQYFQGLYATN